MVGNGISIASYYEYLCNIDRRKQSDLITRWEEKSKKSLLMCVEGVFRKANMDIDFMDGIGAKFMQGPKEQDLLFGCIEEFMHIALIETVNTSLEKDVSLRTAAYCNAQTRINNMFESVGIVV